MLMIFEFEMPVENKLFESNLYECIQVILKIAQKSVLIHDYFESN